MEIQIKGYHPKMKDFFNAIIARDYKEVVEMLEQAKAEGEVEGLLNITHSSRDVEEDFSQTTYFVPYKIAITALNKDITLFKIITSYSSKHLLEEIKLSQGLEQSFIEKFAAAYVSYQYLIKEMNSLIYSYCDPKDNTVFTSDEFDTILPLLGAITE
jgi:hypothetical protein